MKDLPTWAVMNATPSDRVAAKKAYEDGIAKIVFRDSASLRQWMKGKGWKRSWFSLRESFIKQLFDNDENYRLVLREHILEILIPKKNAVISEQELKHLDESYDTRSWSYVVEALREIRRAVEAGVVIEVDGKTLKSWNEWYTWAHGRYHLLEEGSDKWIGDDRVR